MNHRFTLPIALALAAHASLLFGFRHSAPKPGTPTKTVLARPVDSIRIEQPEERTVTPDEAGPAKGSPSEDVARSIERPTAADDRTPFVIDALPVQERWSMAVTFDPQPPGVPHGRLGGSGISGIWSAGSLDRIPRAQVQSPPDYPFGAKRDGLEGEVLVEFIVDETGRVLSPSVVRSTNAAFEEASLRAVEKWRFEPGRRENQVVRFRMTVPVVFHLNGS